MGPLAGNRNKEKGKGKWRWSGRRKPVALLCREFGIPYTHSFLLVQTHNMTAVKEIAEQCCQL